MKVVVATDTENLKIAQITSVLDYELAAAIRRGDEVAEGEKKLNFAFSTIKHVKREEIIIPKKPKESWRRGFPRK